MKEERELKKFSKAKCQNIQQKKSWVKVRSKEREREFTVYSWMYVYVYILSITIFQSFWLDAGVCV
jgi:hypothetical protein